MRRSLYSAYTDRRKARQCLFLKSEFNYGIKEFRSLKRAIEAGELPAHEAAEQKSRFLKVLKQDLDRATRFGCKWAIRASVPLGQARRRRRRR
jgi:hypothetical protein